MCCQWNNCAPIFDLKSQGHEHNESGNTAARFFLGLVLRLAILGIGKECENVENRKKKETNVLTQHTSQLINST
ncbi:4237_t:CDS:2 [Acaulospora colombiana]|uniref:4237_t:CDS:1 n=1 Tax=Acaulospora colombiana TaxID=27376 RepID=A0ACA9KUQ5_9GLOM|nr:4237_t:CDS:2 [Acaulospora colombiana]